jgi:hypothetical protein
MKMFREPATSGEGPQKDVEYTIQCKYQPGPFKTEMKPTKIKF